MMESTFPTKFLKRIDKIDTSQIEAFLSQVLREKAFLEVILDSITEGVIVTERGMRVNFINETARQLLGLMRTECAGKLLGELIKWPAVRSIISEFSETQKPISQREVRVSTPRRRLYAITVVPIENEDSLITHAVWIISDRTEAWRRAKESQQKENIESLQVLTAGVAHEVKNPLNSLNIHAQLAAKAARELREQHGDAPMIDRLEKSSQIILEEIERLKRVVDDFIRAVRPVRPDLRKESLSQIVVALAELMGPECKKRGIDLTLDMDPEIPQLLLDRERIYQALLNILKNAMEAIEQDEGRIDIRTTLKTDHVLIDVEDNGCGIPEEDRLRIFEPYHSTKFSGTGLGLVLVYQIIKAHRGAIALHSEVGVGTVFSVALPLDERPVRMLASQVEPDMEKGMSNPEKAP